MTVINHEGPKAQIHLSNQSEPLWFVSARDAIAFTRLPEEPGNISAIYVTDMSGTNWSNPEMDARNWVNANDAFFVINSQQKGGMGSAEAVPFRLLEDAKIFAQSKGGKVVNLAEVNTSYVLGN